MQSRSRRMQEKPKVRHVSKAHLQERDENQSARAAVQKLTSSSSDRRRSVLKAAEAYAKKR